MRGEAMRATWQSPRVDRAVALAAAVAISARAEVVQKGDLRVATAGTLAPNAAAAQGHGPDRGHGRRQDHHHRRRPAAAAEEHADRAEPQGQARYRGLPTCRNSQIQPGSTPERSPTAAPPWSAGAASPPTSPSPARSPTPPTAGAGLQRHQRRQACPLRPHLLAQPLRQLVRARLQDPAARPGPLRHGPERTVPGRWPAGAGSPACGCPRNAATPTRASAAASSAPAARPPGASPGPCSRWPARPSPSPGEEAELDPHPHLQGAAGECMRRLAVLSLAALSIGATGLAGCGGGGEEGTETIAPTSASTIPSGQSTGADRGAPPKTSTNQGTGAEAAAELRRRRPAPKPPPPACRPPSKATTRSSAGAWRPPTPSAKVAALVQRYLDARAAGDWATVCSQLAAKPPANRASSRAVPPAPRRWPPSPPTPHVDPAKEADIDVLSLRVGDRYSFLITAAPMASGRRR